MHNPKSPSQSHSGRHLKVALDATPLLGNRTGVGEFCLSALNGLAALNRCDVGAYVVSWRGRGRVEPLLPQGVRLIGRPMPARPVHRAWRTFSVPPIEWFTGKLDVVHGTNFVVPPARAARVVSVYDLTMIRFPELCQPATLAFPALIRRAVEHGAWVHVTSKFVASEVQDVFGVEPERIRVVHHGLAEVSGQSHASKRQPLQAAPSGSKRIPVPGETTPGDSSLGTLPSRPLRNSEDLGLPEWVGQYILAIGTIEPRKGLPRLVEAFDQLASNRPDLALVLVGPDGWGTAELESKIEAIHHGKRVVRMGWVDEQRRAALLASATCLAYPSIYEGFGIPPLQAMVAGVPVVATSAGSLPEILGDAAKLVALGDTDLLAQSLAEVIDSESLRYSLVERGFAWVSQYTQKACAEGLMDIYSSAVDASA